MTADERYRLHAYVCGQSCIKWTDNVGWSTFEQIYVGRPDNCRYAIAERTKQPEYIVWDLYNVEMRGRLIKPIPPSPDHIHTTIDAAVAATQILYDKERS